MPGRVWDEGDPFAVWPVDGVRYYRQSVRSDIGIRTDRLEDAEGRLDKIWGGFMRYRANNLDRLAGLSHEGECSAA